MEERFTSAKFDEHGFRVAGRFGGKFSNETIKAAFEAASAVGELRVDGSETGLFVRAEDQATLDTFAERVSDEGSAVDDAGL